MTAAAKRRFAAMPTHRASRSPRLRRIPRLALAAPLVCVGLLGAAPAQDVGGAAATATAKSVQAGFRHAAPAELFEVVKVVDPDTIHILRNGQVEKLRLLSVDSEEKLEGFSGTDPLKPGTVYGEECALWANEFFSELADGDQPARVGLAFPNGVEARGTYGRLLCHVLLPDGTDFNLLLVERGISPYFNKYGNSRICHDAFVAAQAAARERQLGVWNPATNRPKNPGDPAASRPYDLLLPWWDARARAIDEYRARAAQDPEHVIAAELPASLERGVAADADVDVFGTIYRIFDEDNGDRTVLMRGDPDRALRIRIPKASVPAFAAVDLAGTTESLRQNCIWVRGRLSSSRRGGFYMESDDPADWSVAQPAFRAAAESE